MNKLTEIQACYLAGFVDADGSIIAQVVVRDDYVLKYQLRVQVNFHQKIERQVYLKRILDELGTGTFRDRKDGQCEVSVTGHKTVGPLLKMLQPYLRQKQKQANLVLSVCEQLSAGKGKDPYGLLELCKISDHVSSLNDSKHRTQTSEKVKRTLLDLGLIKDENSSP